MPECASFSPTVCLQQNGNWFFAVLSGLWPWVPVFHYRFWMTRWHTVALPSKGSEVYFWTGENESYRRNRCPFQFMHKYATLVVARQWVTVAVVPRWFTAQWIAALLHEGDGRFVPMQMRGLCLFPVQQWFKGVYHDLMRLPLLVLTNFMGSFLLRQAASQKTDFRSPRIDRDWT